MKTWKKFLEAGHDDRDTVISRQVHEAAIKNVFKNVSECWRTLGYAALMRLG